MTPALRFLRIILLLLPALFSSYGSYAAFPIRDSCVAQLAPGSYPQVEKAPRTYKHDKHGKQKIFGYLAFFCAIIFVLAPLAVIFGIMGVSRNRGAHGWARAGLGLGSIECAILLLGVVLPLIMLQLRHTKHIFRSISTPGPLKSLTAALLLAVLYPVLTDTILPKLKLFNPG